jgi:uncharacterized membrane protein YGL010W
LKSLTGQLAQYAGYHRDRRNIATHLVGIPLIVWSIAVLLSRPSVTIGLAAVSPSSAVFALLITYYILLDAVLGLYMAGLIAILLFLASWTGNLPTAAWLATGIAAFVIGWAFQFLGHYYEGRKPAFVDDIVGLAIGPLFVGVELLFLLGYRKQLSEQIDAIAGPMRG